MTLHERHENEQYFFDDATLAHLTTVLSRFDAPCCLCAPLLGRALVEAGQSVAILDIDDRFASLPGFRRFDIAKPEWLGEEYDVIVCDPPFYNVSLTQLFASIRTLARNDYRQKLLVAYLARRSTAVERSFARFKLKATGYFPSYETVEKCERNEIELFGNLCAEELSSLRLDS